MMLIKGLSSRRGKIGPILEMYEYNINDIISEEDDLPSLQIHTKQFLGCFPNTTKIHIMTPSFPKMADIVGI